MKEWIENSWNWLLALVLAAFQPLSVAIIVLMIACTFNIIMGIAVDKIKNKTDFSLSKAFSAVIQMLFLFGALLMISLATTGFEEVDLGKMIVKWLTWVVTLFYGINIFRNGNLLWPNNKAISFIYSFLSTEAFGYIKEFFKMKGGIK